MISLDKLQLRLGSKLIYDEISAHIQTGDRIGLVGSNGSGKTTLLRVLQQPAMLDGGSIQQANAVTLGYLPQDGITAAGRSAYDEVASVFIEVIHLRAQMEQWEQRLGELPHDGEEYAEVVERLGAADLQLEALGAYTMKSDIEKVLFGLGFNKDDMTRDTAEFSGGWQMRLALAKLLLRRPTLLLLDEPTNHLDLSAQRWLEKYLRGYPGALMVVSHDRSFLDALCTRIFLLSMGRLTVYAGNYSDFVKAQAAQRQQQLVAHQAQQKYLQKQQEYINRFRAKASKAKQVQSRIKAVDKVERIVLEQEEKSIQFRFPPVPRCGQAVLKLDNVHKAFGEHVVYEQLNLRLERGDRVAVVGLNGAGKSTLLRILAGIESFQYGERHVGTKVALAYFAQHQGQALHGEKTVLEIAEEAASDTLPLPIRSALGAFLFRGDEVFKPVSVLSGGERNRLALCTMLLQATNCLLLDEPTNHLDIPSIEMLQRALQEYTGTFVIVSHDRSFMDPIVNKVLEVSHQGLRLFPGNVTDYITWIEENETPSVNTAGGAHEGKKRQRKSQNSQRLRRQIKKLTKEKEQLEARIAELEAQKTTLERKLSDQETYQDAQQFKTLSDDHGEVEQALADAYESWAGSAAELEAMNKTEE